MKNPLRTFLVLALAVLLPASLGAATPTPVWTNTVTSTITPTLTITNTSTPTSTPSATPSVTKSITQTFTFSPTLTVTTTATPTVTKTSTITRTITQTWTYSKTPTPTITITATPTVTPTRTATPTPSPTFTFSPTMTPGTYPWNANGTYVGILRPANCTDFSLVASTAWTWINPGCNQQPCVLDVSVPETAAYTMRYWRSTASTTPVVSGNPILPGGSTSLIIRPAELFWYKTGAASTVSGSAQSCVNK